MLLAGRVGEKMVIRKFHVRKALANGDSECVSFPAADVGGDTVVWAETERHEAFKFNQEVVCCSGMKKNKYKADCLGLGGVHRFSPVEGKSSRVQSLHSPFLLRPNPKTVSKQLLHLEEGKKNPFSLASVRHCVGAGFFFPWYNSCCS